MLEVPGWWIWDSWYLSVGDELHAFYLKAPRSLGDPDLRHHHARIGHSRSTDLVRWRELPDALVPSAAPAFDDLATWTGSALVDADGMGHLFYTGISRETLGVRQRVGHAVSEDLVTWQRVDAPVVAADPRWYATLDNGDKEDWRDPWVFRDEADDCWRMLITAETPDGADRARGCVGTAVSTDLMTWTVQPPLASHVGFGQLEVLQTVEIDGAWVVVWCMHADDYRGGRATPDGGAPITGTWSAPALSQRGPFDLAAAEPIRVTGTYAGRVVSRTGRPPALVAFADLGVDGTFGGYLIDPVPLRLTERGTLQPAG